jgi:hypothetical protein
VKKAEKIAEQAAVDPKQVMRGTFGSSAERANTIAGVTDDQVGKIGGGAGLKTKPSGLTVDHIVSIDQITEMEGFEKLTRGERKALAYSASPARLFALSGSHTVGDICGLNGGASGIQNSRATLSSLRYASYSVILSKRRSLI